MQADGVALHIVNKFYELPPRREPVYLEMVLDRCKKEAIAAMTRMTDFNAIRTGLSPENRST